MERFVKRDIAIIDFPFSSLKKSKRRPVLVLKVPKGGGVIVNQITSPSYEKSVEVKVENKDFN